MTMPRRKRLIEVAFPLEEVSSDSRIDKYRSAPHPQTLHPWWARRPLAACRAFIYASLVDDPDSDREREDLLKEVADLASWDAVRHPTKVVRTNAEGGSGLTGTQLLERARRRILDCNGGKPPKLLDPFAGGGAIPLEGLRLGCAVEASDLNPVAVLILRGTLEYAQKYGQPNSRPVPHYILHADDILRADDDDYQSTFGDDGFVDSYRNNPLATDVWYWGSRVIGRVRNLLNPLYPSYEDGSLPVCYLWCRTIECPSCTLQVPLFHSTSIGTEGGRQVIVTPRLVDREWQFGLERHDDSSASSATSVAGSARCQQCGQVVTSKEVRSISSRLGMGEVLFATLVTKSNLKGKTFREIRDSDRQALRLANQLLPSHESYTVDGYTSIPDENIARGTLGVRVGAYGVTKWAQVFGPRQLALMSNLAQAIRSTWGELVELGVESDYASAICTYLGCFLSRVGRENNSYSTWNPLGQKSQGIFSQPKLSMVWDYTEVNPFGGSVGDLQGALEIVVKDILGSPSGSPALVSQEDASKNVTQGIEICVTDPPYYQALDYAGLSDFFYVWLKRAIAPAQPTILGLPLTPKDRQAIVRSERKDEGERRRYLGLMASSFQNIGTSITPDASFGVVFAHSDPDAWATLIDAVIEAGLLPVASWPIDTESRTKVANVGKARLQTSVWMTCRKRDEAAAERFLSDVMEEMRPVIRERLLYFWGKGIRGADFFISAIGPALSVFGRHSLVLRPDGEAVTVREFLDIVRRESTAVALEQVLHSADLGQVDPITRQYVTWVWSYSRAPLDSGEAIALCLATGAVYDEMTRPNSIAVEIKEKSKKLVRLRTIRQRSMDDDDLGNGHAARPTPLIDQLQHAAWLWSQNLSERLAAYRGQLGETRWSAMQTLGQAIAECLPDGDEDRRIILGLLGSSVMATAPRRNGKESPPRLPGFEDSGGENS